MSVTRQPEWPSGDSRDHGGSRQPLLIADNLKKYFPITGGPLNWTIGYVQAVESVSFSIMEGETLGVVGESGCGKSTLARLLLHLLVPDAGELIFDGDLVNRRHGISIQELRRNAQMVFQDSYASLNPRMPVEDSIAYGPSVHGASRSEAKTMARDLLRKVGLDPDLFAPRYPHELSGGQKQRVNIARALALEPRLVILDEAVSALDKSVEAQVLNLLMDLKRQLNLTYMFISHDLDVVQFISDRVLVMYLGQVVEIGPVDAIYKAPKHPYTRALLASCLSMDPDVRIDEPPLSGDPPNPISPPSGCRFRTRCPHTQEVCALVPPRLPSDLASAIHGVACHMYDTASGHTEAVTPEALIEPFVMAPPAPPRPKAAVQVEASKPPEQSMPQPLVDVRDLNVTFVSREATVHAVNDVSFSVMPGEVMCIIGESGSGKTVTLRSMMRLFPRRRTVITGAVRIAEYNMLALKSRELPDVRGTTVAMIFQEPMTALDPVYTVGRQIAETVVRHEGCSYQEGYRRALDLLNLVKVPSAERRLSAYPHELSGGLRQRAMIAMALSCRPSLLLADEPTTALDATVQIQVLILLRQLQAELGMGIIFVTHDIGVAAEISDNVAVMYAGRMVEQGSVRDILRRPLHPYTEGMLAATVLGQQRGSRIEAIPGSPPDLRRLPLGCSFAPRCRYVSEACIATLPEEQVLDAGRMARCIHLGSSRKFIAPQITLTPGESEC